ncbi:MAG TPA: SRPBCC family protein [Gemmatimonadales bacterium]
MGSKTFIGGLTVGAGLVYLLDPERGKLRRERLRETLEILVDEARGRGAAPAGSEVVGTLHYGSRLGDIEGLGEATLGSRQRPGGAAGTALRVAGAVLALYALTRGGRVGSLLKTVGTGLLLGGLGKGGAGIPGVARGDRRRAVDIQKSLVIEAPVEQVYAFWSNYENFPLFMSHVREVEDLGGGRSHWSVSGPGGVPIEWDAVLTQQSPGEAIAWRSEPGSMLENAGVIRFTPTDGGTRVDLRLCYHPPAGGAGQAVAELIGTDPRAKLNEDLGRMKSLLEATTRSGAHGQKSRS